MQFREEDREAYLVSFSALRAGVGYLGLLLPVALFVIGQFWRGTIEPSMSQFYFTEGHDIFVGTLCAIGVFLVFYTGYKRRPGEWFSDRWLARIAGLAAVIVAFVPTGTRPSDPIPAIHRLLGDSAPYIHYGAAAAFFVCLALFCLKQFVKGGHRRRNRFYRACGRVIIASLVAMVAIFFLPTDAREALEARHAIFWLETVGVLAFAAAWLVKGETFLLRETERMVERMGVLQDGESPS